MLIYSKNYLFKFYFKFSFNKNLLLYFSTTKSTNDDQFWHEYTNRKPIDGKIPALKSQEIIYNKAEHSWKYSQNVSLTCDQLYDAIKDLKINSDPCFIIVDVREDHELELFKLPDNTKVYIKFILGWY